ncbi:carboxypeptidase M32 [Thalassospira sp.]|uniref:carboxypeptidase M32 n=1 Tax=Thalassospira sp. TaxID=1912094 RepID=UPI001B1F0A8D|nr:carboxypeptidase M32 [Thalassospira sp.]MBO6578705.1 carboxypeptidase M32 [Thalassospira sp.]MBO6802532.1 carboxypeptidase M32 [Thalassospira sp.]MBO6817389.1 carboxypeptidase M32 [Thalassospira sp.]
MTEAYKKLEARFHRMSVLSGIGGMLHWDMAVIMPDGGADARSEQLATLSVLENELINAPDLGDLISSAESEQLDDWQQANLAEMKRAWVHGTAVPADLVEKMSRAETRCEVAWRKARADNDFKGLLPHLQEVLDLSIEAGKAKAEALGTSVYDALLDQYDPMMRSDRIDSLFAELESFLPDFTADVIERQKSEDKPIKPTGPFAIETQNRIGLDLMKAVGFDFDHGRLDISHHPFCGGIPEDVRLTTRYDENDFTSAIMGVLHETGHAMYERGLPADWQNQPVGKARGMTMHESQSLLVEMQACRSEEFLTYAGPVFKEAFGGDNAAWGAANLHRLYTRVEPGLIRVDADEVTYPAHVILRYRLERALIEGDMKLADLPGAWNELMQKLLGIVPEDDRNGCMQDIHWPSGAWGYFPTYTLGAMAAAQIFAAAKESNPEIPNALSRGDFAPLMGWLSTNIHSQASSKSTDAILEAATGKPLGVDAFRTHLENRYGQ